MFPSFIMFNSFQKYLSKQGNKRKTKICLVMFIKHMIIQMSVKIDLDNIMELCLLCYIAIEIKWYYGSILTINRVDDVKKGVIVTTITFVMPGLLTLFFVFICKSL